MKGNMRLQASAGANFKAKTQDLRFPPPLPSSNTVRQQLCFQPSSLWRSSWITSVDAVGVTSDRLCSNQDEENELSVLCMSSGFAGVRQFNLLCSNSYREPWSG